MSHLQATPSSSPPGRGRRGIGSRRLSDRLHLRETISGLRSGKQCLRGRRSGRRGRSAAVAVGVADCRNPLEVVEYRLSVCRRHRLSRPSYRAIQRPRAYHRQCGAPLPIAVRPRHPRVPSAWKGAKLRRLWRWGGRREDRPQRRTRAGPARRQRRRRQRLVPPTAGLDKGRVIRRSRGRRRRGHRARGPWLLDQRP